MIDIEYIRDCFEDTAANLAKRGVARASLEKLVQLDEEWRKVTAEVENLRAKQNEANKELGELSASDKKKQIEKLRGMSDEIKGKENKLVDLTEDRDKEWHSLPNLVMEEVPVGEDESANKVLREVGDIPKFEFEAKEHWELGKQLGVIDTETAAEVAGSRFNYLRGDLVHLQFALVQMALSVLTDMSKLDEIAKGADLAVSVRPFVPIIPPVFIRPEVYNRMARLEPREERYHIESDDLYLIGSAEHTMGPMHMDETIAEKRLPLRYVGYSASFRREAGSYGKDVKGILRVHQFDKLEIESFSSPESSVTEQDFIVAIQEYLMQQLGIPYRVVIVATGDMGDPDARQIDIEAWLPGQNKYRETHTSDLMTDYQARRLQTRVKRGDGKTDLVHMNDATVFAMGRTLIAIMENYQREDGSITVPEALKKFVPFEVIKKA